MVYLIGKSFCGALGGACAKFGPEQGRARAPDIRWLEYTPVNLEQLEYHPCSLSATSNIDQLEQLEQLKYYI